MVDMFKREIIILGVVYFKQLGIVFSFNYICIYIVGVGWEEEGIVVFFLDVIGFGGDFFWRL